MKMSSGAVYYNAYKAETEKNNVEPEIIRGFADVAAFERNNNFPEKPYSHAPKFWSGPGCVYHLPDGRVAELSQTNSAVGTPLLAIFANQTDHCNYRRAMPLNTFLYG
jgi:hypothetical protein